MSAKLIVASGKSAGRAISLKNRRLLIGRAEDCDIRPLGEDVSRRHCSIVLDADVLTVEDLGSRNGTYVNGAKIEAKTKVAVKHGDIVRVGPLEVKVEMAADKPAAAAAMDDVSRWLMADDEPAGMFDTTQTIRTNETPASAIPVAEDSGGKQAAPAASGSETVPAATGREAVPAATGREAVPAATGREAVPAATGSSDAVPAAAADDSAARAATSIEALVAARTRPGTLPQDAKRSKSESSKDAAADALRKFFGKR